MDIKNIIRESYFEKNIVTNKKYQNYNRFLNYNETDLIKTTNQIKKNGYGLLKNVIPINKCNNLIAHLRSLHKSRIKNTNKLNLYKYKEEHFIYTKHSQALIRNLILEKPEIFMPLISLSPVLKIVSNIMKEILILDGCTSSNSINNNNYKSTRHVDTHLATKNIDNTLDMVAVLCLNDFNSSNGGTVIWPKTHKTGIAINRNPAWSKKYLNKCKTLIAPQGSIAFMLGQLWHSIGKNTNNKDRWSILLHYKRWWIKPSTDYTRCGKKIFNRLNAEQKILLGFNSIVPIYNNKNRQKTLIKKNQISQNYKKALNY